MQPEPKPFDPLTDDLPPPNMAAFDMDVLKERLGIEVGENILLRSQINAVTQHDQQLQMQVAALKQENATLKARGVQSDGFTDPNLTTIPRLAKQKAEAANGA